MLDSLSINPSRGKGKNKFHQFVLSIYINKGLAFRKQKLFFDSAVLVKLVFIQQIIALGIEFNTKNMLPDQIFYWELSEKLF